jgi:predicted anti-sigma-YlaC factor YlaD
MEYLDGELNAVKKTETEQHLKKCAHCSEFLSAMQQQYEMLSALLLLSPGQDFTQKVMSNIGSKKADDGTTDITKMQIMPAIILVAAVLALCIPKSGHLAGVVPAAINFAAWFAVMIKGLSGIFNAVLWMMDFAVKMLLDLQPSMYFLETIPGVLLNKYPAGAALIAAAFLLECFLWGKLLSPGKIEQ